jgi:hypothetical protein
MVRAKVVRGPARTMVSWWDEVWVGKEKEMVVGKGKKWK